MAVAAPTVTRVVFRGLLVPILAIAGYLLCLGMAYAADGIVRALFGSLAGKVGWIPWAGKVIQAPIHTIVRKLTGYLGRIEAALEKRIAATFNDLAKLIVGLSVDIYDTALLLSEMSWHLTKGIPAAALGRRLSTVARKATTAQATADRALSLARNIDAADRHPGSSTAGANVRVQIRPLRLELRRFERTTNSRVTALEHAIAAPIPHVGVRDRAPSYPARREIGRLWKRVRAHERLLVGGAGIALVLRAMAKLKLGWLRCSNVSKLGRRTCSLDSALLESLLSGSLILVSGVSIVELARELQGSMEFAEDAMRTFVREL